MRFQMIADNVAHHCFEGSVARSDVTGAGSLKTPE
jgi:hypothetical protein